MLFNNTTSIFNKMKWNFPMLTNEKRMKKLSAEMVSACRDSETMTFSQNKIKISEIKFIRDHLWTILYTPFKIICTFLEVFYLKTDDLRASSLFWCLLKSKGLFSVRLFLGNKKYTRKIYILDFQPLWSLRISTGVGR